MNHHDDAGLGYAEGLSVVRAAMRWVFYSLLIMLFFTPLSLRAQAALDSNSVIWDFRYGKHVFYGTRSWGFKSVTEADSLNRLKKIIDSTKTYGAITLSRGTWTVGNPINLTYPLRLEGTVASRLRNDQSNLFGTIIKSTSSTKRDTFGIIQASFQGIRLSELSLQGNDKQNSHGLYSYRSNSPVITTLGGYSIVNSSSNFNGKDGFNFEGSDGNLFYNLETYGNGRYGMMFTNPQGNGKFVKSGSEVTGTTNVILSGRMRRNAGGGIHVNETDANAFIGTQSVTDTVFNVWTRNTNRTMFLNGDYEFAIPPRTFSGTAPISYNMKSDNDRHYTMINTYHGSIHTQGTYTADAGTNTTRIVDAGLPEMPNDYYVGFEVTNNTTGSGAIEVTDYKFVSGAPDTLFLASAIPSQTTGNSYTLTKKPNRGFWADSLVSGVFINNAFAHSADSSWVTTGYANAIFINTQNFDPETNIYNLGGAQTKWYSMELDAFNPDGQLDLFSNTKTLHKVISDSFIVRSTGSKGVKLDATGGSGVVDIQYEGDGNASFFRNVSDDESPQTRFYFDANLSSGVNRQYIQFARSGAQSNALLVSSSAESLKVVYGTPLELSGNDGTARFVDVLASNATPTPTILNNRVRLYGKSDKLWAKDDNGNDVNIMPFTGSTPWDPASLADGATATTTVTCTGASVGDAVAVGFSSITAGGWILSGSVTSSNTVTVTLMNKTGGTVDLSSGTLKARVWN